MSKRSSRSSLTTELRANEAVKLAELMVEAKSLKIQQRLDQEKLRIQQEECINLEIEIAKSAAKEKALATLQNSPPNSFQTGTITLEVSQSPTVAKSQPRGSSTERKLPQPTFICKAEENASIMNQYGSQERDRPEKGSQSQNNSSLEIMLRLQEQQNELNLQQNKIMQGFCLQQLKCAIPQQRVSIIEGNPTE